MKHLMKKILIIFLAIFFCFVQARNNSANSGHQTASAQKQTYRNGMSQILDEFLTRAETYGFSGSVIIAKGNQIILRKGYGLIDRQRNLPVTPETVFSIASLDKQFIAAAVLKLEELGKLKVTDSITRFFDFVPKDKKDITVHQLLSHTSGLPNDYWDEHKELSRAEYVRYILNNLKLESQPGSTWDYNNAGFIILEEIISRASGKPYEEFINDAIFRPAGLTNTGFPLRHWNPDVVAKYRFWTMDIDKYFVDATDVLARPQPLWVMLSTIDDLYKWYQALKDNKILSDASKKKLFTPILENYAYGWNIIQTSRGTKLIHHGGSGSGIGMNASFRWFVDEDVFIGILSNSSNFTISSDYFMGDVESILFGGSVNLPPPSSSFWPTIPKRNLGKYKLPDGTSFEILQAAGNRLVIKSFDPGAVIMVRFPNSVAPFEHVPQDTFANEILYGAAQNDFEPLRKFITKPGVFENEKSRLQRFLSQFSNLGKLQNVSTIDQKWFNPENQPEVQSFIQLQFDKAKVVVRFIHLPNGNFTFNQINTEGIESLLVPTQKNEYRTWDFTLNTSLKIVFPEQGSQLKIQSPYGEITATRVGDF